MNQLRRLTLSAALLLATALTGCALFKPVVKPQARQALAPSGTLRVGVYPGSPTSLVTNAKTGEKAGVALELGTELARQLGVPVQVVEFSRLALVLESLKTGQVDMTFTNATEVRARDMDFVPPMLRIELGYLVAKTSSITQPSDVLLSGVRVGVSQGSTSQATYARDYKSVTVLPMASLKEAQESLRQRKIDVFATNKGILFEMSDGLPDFRVLDGRWGFENMAIAIPKGRDAGRPFVAQFAQEVRSSGLLQSVVARAGLRGTVNAP